MTTQDITLFKAIGAKMDYLNQRQRVISQNIANTDTPGYYPQDIKEEDFGGVLKSLLKDKSETVRLETTQPLHMPAAGSVPDPKSAKQKRVYEVAPVGNAVVMEEQLMNSNKTALDYTLMTNLLQKNMGLIRTALGTQR